VSWESFFEELKKKTEARFAETIRKPEAKDLREILTQN
jgi:hypothetical protein